MAMAVEANVGGLFGRFGARIAVVLVSTDSGPTAVGEACRCTRAASMSVFARLEGVR
jgi:hypothetical protein